MSAKNDILEYLKSKGHDGALQSELYNLGYSRSTIAEALEALEKEKRIVKKNIGKKAYRIWAIDEAPFPIKNTLRLGILRAVEYPHALLTAYDLREKYNVRVLVYNSALELTNALAIGKVDLACSPLITQLLYSLLMKSIKIVSGCGFAGSGLVVRGELEEGKTIASSELSTMETMLKLFLEKGGLKNIKVTYFKNPENAVRSFLSGEIDGISIWEPYLTLLKKKGFDVYHYSNYFGKYPCCALGVNLSFLDVNEDIFKEFFERFKYNTENLEKRKEEAIRLMVEVMDFDEKLVRESFGGFVYDYRLTKKQVEEMLNRFGLKVFNLEKLFLSQDF
ncbi:ABC transporter substrate-binding protein [Thermococcus sp. SY098]|uniref:ABC transporter substrate-binding protein n=1 Tax=Thermococcus sp. SY098 TaxID=3111325 RepID=UPI002D799902|nr:ABC transporter substrate-binding protein [Thermococcus sp. SY098]WRS52534.1 ABC transporter substrate-binding protein [Thermococcus sp. SY098]